MEIRLQCLKNTWQVKVEPEAMRNWPRIDRMEGDVGSKESSSK